MYIWQQKNKLFSFFFLWKIFKTFLSLRTVTHAGKFRPKMCFIRHHKKSPTGCHYYILLSCLIKIMPQYVAQFEIQFRRTFWTTLDANLCEGVGVFILIQWEPQGCLIFSKQWFKGMKAFEHAKLGYISQIVLYTHCVYHFVCPFKQKRV